jgi:5-formyltetrahydrofolate cyclo-ligase
MKPETPSNPARWQGRNSEKDTLRAEVWSALEAGRANVGEVWSHIPNYVGAEQAAERLAALPFWEPARVVKSNPDAAQIPVRLKALQAGKILYTPVPELSQDFPFLRLDPAELQRRGITFEEVAPISGALQHGQKVRFEEMEPMDVLVVGCVAVTRSGGRTGKGGGFADLELGIFHALGLVPPQSVIVTTVHPTQVVPDDRLVMLGHDCPLDWIITPAEVIQTHTQLPRPTGVDWDAVRPDQYASIPFLHALRARLEK